MAILTLDQLEVTSASELDLTSPGSDAQYSASQVEQMTNWINKRMLTISQNSLCRRGDSDLPSIPGSVYLGSLGVNFGKLVNLFDFLDSIVDADYKRAIAFLLTCSMFPAFCKTTLQPLDSVLSNPKTDLLYDSFCANMDDNARVTIIYELMEIIMDIEPTQGATADKVVIAGTNDALTFLNLTDGTNETVSITNRT